MIVFWTLCVCMCVCSKTVFSSLQNHPPSILFPSRSVLTHMHVIIDAGDRHTHTATVRDLQLYIPLPMQLQDTIP